MKDLSELKTALKLEKEAVHFGYQTAEGQKKLWEALKTAQDYLAVNVSCYEAWDICGNILVKLGHYMDAYFCYVRVREHSEAFFDKKCEETGIALRNGEYLRGWLNFERRYAILEQDAFYRLLQGHARWNGKTMLESKTILLHAEQGLGDTIQFVRFLPLLRERLSYCKIILVVQKEIACLLSGFQGCYDELILYGIGEKLVLPQFDFAVGLISLPLLLGIYKEELFWYGEYVKVNKSDIEEKTLKLERCYDYDKRMFNIGLIWGAGRGEEYDRIRSLTVRDCAALSCVQGLNFFSLQKGLPQRDFEAIRESGLKVKDLSGDINNFMDTAAFIAGMDVVLTVDTSVAHLAGAMGKKTILLLNTLSLEWRWRCPKKQTAWYPNTELLWQKRPGDWSGVISKVAGLLWQKAAAKNLLA